MYKSSDLKWVKSIKRASGTDWAYFESGTEQEFNLGFSKQQRKSSSLIKHGELLLLFQAVDNMHGVTKKTYLTHIVTPLDDVLIEGDPTHRHFLERRVAVIARANPKTAIYSNPKILNFKRVGFGRVDHVQKLNLELKQEEIAATIFVLFKDYMLTDAVDYISGVTSVLEYLINEDFGAFEGMERKIIREHLVKERNPGLIKRAKERALKNGNQRILCECCTMDFVEQYGPHGCGFIECHHQFPVATSGIRYNRLEDLHMVCSNCHRMLHRKITGSNEFHTIATLRESIKKSV